MTTESGEVMENNDADEAEEGVEGDETEASAENEIDKVKPVIYIGLVLTALFGLGKNELLIMENTK